MCFVNLIETSNVCLIISKFIFQISDLLISNSTKTITTNNFVILNTIQNVNITDTKTFAHLQSALKPHAMKHIKGCTLQVNKLEESTCVHGDLIIVDSTLILTVLCPFEFYLRAQDISRKQELTDQKYPNSGLFCCLLQIQASTQST